MPDFHEPTIATLLASASRDVTANGAAVGRFQAKECIQVVLDVTAAASAADDELDVVVSVSPDGGTTWLPAVAFPTVLGNGGAKRYVAELLPKWADPATSTVDISADPSPGDVRPYLLGTHLKAVGTITNGAGTHTFTYGVTAIGR